jgi:hypothetical protein
MQSLTTRWILILGIATLFFGISLFVLRIPIRTIGIFFALGIPLILLWFYADDKSKRQQERGKAGSNSTSNNFVQHQQTCICSMKGNKIIGRSINPMQ